MVQEVWKSSIECNGINQVNCETNESFLMRATDTSGLRAEQVPKVDTSDPVVLNGRAIAHVVYQWG